MIVPPQTTLAGRYLLERELGRGGMAVVWLARDLQHGRPVAIKLLHPELAGAIGVDRFIREVRLAAGLQHPNIVPILDSGLLELEGGTPLPWYAMAYLEGESLRTRLLRDQQLPIADALHVTSGVADALQVAHQQGVVHRDIKPENILLSGEQVYVIDFGIAKALIETGGERLTSTGLAIGTPAYMSPEQAAAGAVDARSDQYSLAAVLYEMLTGEPPFSGPTAQAIMARRFAETPRPIRTVRPTVPAPVEAAVLRALERVPADRHTDVAAFRAALRDSPSRSGARGAGRWRAVAIGAAVVVVATAGWSVLLRGRGTTPAQPDPTVLALYQRGMRGYERRTPEGTAEAITAFKAALDRDPEYTLAWNGLAQAYSRAYERDFEVPGVPRDSQVPHAVAAVDRALNIDPLSAQAWLTRAIVFQQVDPTDLAPSLQAVRRSLALDSSNARAWHTYGRDLAEVGELSEATAAWRRSVALDPSYTQAVAFLSLAHYWRREYDSAAAWADSAVALDANNLLARSTTGYVAIERGDTVKSGAAFDALRRIATSVEAVNALAGGAAAAARAGRQAEARIMVQEAESLARGYSPVSVHTTVYLAQAAAAAGESDDAFALLTRFQPRRNLHFQLHLRCDPLFDPIAGDPRFRALLLEPRPPAGQGC